MNSPSAALRAAAGAIRNAARDAPSSKTARRARVWTHDALKAAYREHGESHAAAAIGCLQEYAPINEVTKYAGLYPHPNPDGQDRAVPHLVMEDGRMHTLSRVCQQEDEEEAARHERDTAADAAKVEEALVPHVQQAKVNEAAQHCISMIAEAAVYGFDCPSAELARGRVRQCMMDMHREGGARLAVLLAEAILEGRPQDGHWYVRIGQDTRSPHLSTAHVVNGDKKELNVAALVSEDDAQRAGQAVAAGSVKTIMASDSLMVNVRYSDGVEDLCSRATLDSPIEIPVPSPRRTKNGLRQATIEYRGGGAKVVWYGERDGNIEMTLRIPKRDVGGLE